MNLKCLGQNLDQFFFSINQKSQITQKRRGRVEHLQKYTNKPRPRSKRKAKQLFTDWPERDVEYCRKTCNMWEIPKG